ncbi:protein of unknown function DUF77 [Alkaliphilus metalliredigens QYMF]|uniref:Thiamine-binding protein domain-containing protein n=1 Tax=Alkaliphilus metalliredigens (strain QYMF) TaxID=293826 RepID=A6TLH9_ALKMQ|nr:MTH1187 family thiamine-binding protein [Alkaliphilus metalliredigens]ABR47047.1 protein of unknown function DUF77 [Alkaliphilus metalliredigens QYMF]
MKLYKEGKVDIMDIINVEEKGGKQMAIMEITVVPLGTGSTSISQYVASCHRLLEIEEGIKYQLTPMSTVIEGDIEKLFQVAQKLHQVPAGEGAQRISTSIKIDDRKDKVSTMDGKIASVQSKL